MLRLVPQRGPSTTPWGWGRMFHRRAKCGSSPLLKYSLRPSAFGTLEIFTTPSGSSSTPAARATHFRMSLRKSIMLPLWICTIQCRCSCSSGASKTHAWVGEPLRGSVLPAGVYVDQRWNRWFLSLANISNASWSTMPICQRLTVTWTFNGLPIAFAVRGACKSDAPALRLMWCDGDRTIIPSVFVCNRPTYTIYVLGSFLVGSQFTEYFFLMEKVHYLLVKYASSFLTFSVGGNLYGSNSR